MLNLIFIFLIAIYIMLATFLDLNIISDFIFQH